LLLCNCGGDYPQPMKPKTQQAMKRAGITYQVLGEALGKDHTYTNRAIAQRLPPEQAGNFVRALGELTHLTTKERPSKKAA
jgi:hypothetical protein